MATTKPIGENGPLRFQIGQNPTLTWNKINYPATKEEQEALIAGAFAKQRCPAAPYQLTQLPQDDFDFSLEHAGCKVYLELIEITFPGKKRGSPYADAEQKIHSGKSSKTIIEAFQRKRYSKGEYPIILIMYFTHWRFMPGENVKALLKHFLATDNHPYSEVILYMPITAEEGVEEKLFPVQVAKLSEPAITAAREVIYFNFDPSRAQLAQQGPTVGVQFKVPSE
jgi:hypothetical protein